MSNAGERSPIPLIRELGSLFSPRCSQFDHTAIDAETGERTNAKFSDPQDAIRSISVSDPALFNPRATLYGRNYSSARCRTIAWRSDQNPLEMLVGNMQAEYKVSERRRWRITWEYPVSKDIVSLFTTARKRDAINSCCINQERSLEMIKEVYPAHIHKMCADGGEETTAEWISMLMEDARGELKRKKLAKRFNLVLEDGIKL